MDIQLKNRATNLKQKYGLSLEDYNKLFQKQRGRCALCFKPPILGYKPLAVDHCHETGRIRGLLCNECNRLLWHTRTPVFFQRVVDYLNIDKEEKKL